jgi:TRAP-type C4-dicarboxylate transport system substrate-binding protein
MRKLLFLLLLVPAWAHAADPDPPAPVTLRLATVAPDGTAWARELKAFARDVATKTNDSLHVKWYWGGIAGDDVDASDRIRKDQLDGLGSGGMMCERLSPTMRAMHMLLETREEANYVISKVARQIEDEFRRNGYVYLGAAPLGPDVLFTREAVHSLDDLKKVRLWVWDSDEVAKVIYPAVGMRTVPLGVNDALKAFEDEKTDGFVALPTAALAFQWSAHTRYVTDLSMGFVSGCIVVSQRAFDTIPMGARDAALASANKLQARMEDLGKQQDEALLHGGGFSKQGLKQTSVSAEMRDSFRKAALAARAELRNKLVTEKPLEQVQQLVDEFRRQRK